MASGENDAFRYRAFLSYSHRDKGWADWLHGALESFRLDADLVGRRTALGPVPRTLRPIFRDRDDFSAGHSLTEQTLAALRDSQSLIVLCTPNAARSAYVNEEIRAFKALGRAGRIVAVIAEGEPGDSERECFPPALCFRVGADGALTDAREEPIAADARREGDGKRLALVKVVAGLTALPFDDIRKREAINERKRIVRLTAIFAVMGALAVAAGGIGWHSWRQQGDHQVAI